MAEIASLVVADPPELWSELGFVVDDGGCWISGIRHELGAPGKGIAAWVLRGVDSISELPSAESVSLEAQPTPDHPNGVVALDHVVVTTPNFVRTIATFESVGIELRRTRDAGTAERPTKQGFFRMGETIVELVGSATASLPGPARFYGLAFTVADLGVTQAFLGSRLRPTRSAVQTGRWIATLDRAAGSTVPLRKASQGEDCPVG
jgi:hypothetical protein